MTASFLGGALAKQDPSDRVRHALMRDLQSRHELAIATARFPSTQGYVYRGGAELLLLHGEFYPGRELPERYAHLMGQPSRCFNNALLAAQAMPELRYCEGYYTTGFGGPRTHGWCVAPDGGVVELTMPTGEALVGGVAHDTGLPYLPAERWGYWGVIFDARFVQWHLDTIMSIPMLDRPLAEKARTGDGLDYDEPHDWPILKVPYDPTRTELP